MYQVIRRLLFLLPPEQVHHLSMNGLSAAGVLPGVKRIFHHPATQHQQLKKELFGLTFKNPVGLAAGFDKNARYLEQLSWMGFGAIEIGTVTPKPQEGNDKPRLFRIPEHQALINRMGFNNDGVMVVAKRLRLWMNAQKTPEGKNDHPVIGGNIGKNKTTPNDEAWKDYELCFRELFDCVDYFVVNVSSPNTPGLRALQEKDSLLKILDHLQTINRQQPVPKPLLLKIAPDLSKEQLDDVIDLALDIGLDGLVATNTTISRDQLHEVKKERIESIGAGGLSGKPLQQRSTEVVQYIHEKTNGRLPVIASGGIFSAEDAIEKLQAGASLVQVWTGFIYEGPAIVNNICRGLLKRATL